MTLFDLELKPTFAYSTLRNSANIFLSYPICKETSALCTQAAFLVAVLSLSSLHIFSACNCHILFHVEGIPYFSYDSFMRLTNLTLQAGVTADRQYRSSSIKLCCSTNTHILLEAKYSGGYPTFSIVK